MDYDTSAFLAGILDRTGSSIRFEGTEGTETVRIRLGFQTGNADEMEATKAAFDEFQRTSPKNKHSDLDLLIHLRDHLDFRQNQASLAIDTLETQEKYIRKSNRKNVSARKRMAIEGDVALVNLFNLSHRWPEEVRERWKLENFADKKSDEPEARIVDSSAVTLNDLHILGLILKDQENLAGVIPGDSWIKESIPTPYIQITLPDAFMIPWFRKFGGLSAKHLDEVGRKVPRCATQTTVLWTGRVAQNVARDFPEALRGLSDDDLWVFTC